ncbi:MAG: hypothetical protein JWR90_2842 [Marmoricola sp.]|jgi:hypothetical protein|nr:hypothetical protein [Marmoricola sp.]
MNENWNRVRAVAAAALSAVLVGVVGVSVLPTETASAAGVVVERQQPFGATTGREREEQA